MQGSAQQIGCNLRLSALHKDTTTDQDGAGFEKPALPSDPQSRPQSPLKAALGSSYIDFGLRRIISVNASWSVHTWCPSWQVEEGCGMFLSNLLVQRVAVNL